jgi:uncharacterized protein (TIGR02246 family)
MELTADQKAAIADTVNALHAASWDAWRAADVDKGLSYFLNSPDVWWGEEGHALQGYADVEAYFRGSANGVSRYDITISDSRTVVLAADAVAVLQQGVFSATDSAGTTTPEQSFLMSATWVRRDGQWKILYGHESYPVPAADSIR